MKIPRSERPKILGRYRYRKALLDEASKHTMRVIGEEYNVSANAIWNAILRDKKSEEVPDMIAYIRSMENKLKEAVEEISLLKRRVFRTAMELKDAVQ